MVATTAHLTAHVLPPLPVRVLAVPKRLRYFLHRDADLQGAALRVFMRVVEQHLRSHSPGSGPAARLGAVAFIHRFGSTFNAHLHFHCVVIDGVFDSDAAGRVIFTPATAHSPLPLLRRAGATGRSQEISAASAKGRRWPISTVQANERERPKPACGGFFIVWPGKPTFKTAPLDPMEPVA